MEQRSAQLELFEDREPNPRLNRRSPTLRKRKRKVTVAEQLELPLPEPPRP